MPSNEEILLKLIQGDAGAQWASNHIGWKVPQSAELAVNVCDWDGVDCDHSGTRITIIQLTGSGLAATIPSELGQLPYLERLHLDNLIPDGAGLTGTIPSELASLTNLVDVNLAFNSLTGTVPTFVSAKLQTLNLSTNALAGPVPTEFYYGSKGHGYMLCLDLSKNSLTGTISEAIGQLQKLETMSLSDNQFSGTLPASIGVLRDLRYVYLNNNHLQGTFPTDFVNPDAQLSEVWFQSNLLSGTVPIAFGQMDKLRNLYIDDNKFTGTVPKELCTDLINIDFVDADLYDPSTGKNVSTCVRLACPENTFSTEGLWPCGPCPDESSSPYLGTQGECYSSDQRTLLNKFYEITNGASWNIPNNNWMDASIDECTFTGISCNTNGHVTKLSLPKANLQGPFPNIIGFLEHLNYVDLSDNFLTGYLSADLQWAPIDHFDISGNKIRGAIPPWLCLTSGLNENGDKGHFRCSLVACPAGTASPIGRESITENIKCQPCSNGANIVGLKDCKDYNPEDAGSYYYYYDAPEMTSTSSTSGSNASRTAGIIILVFSIVGFVIVAALIYARNLKAKKEDEHEALKSNISSMRSGSSWSLTNREVI